MGNVGAGEVLTAYLIKESVANLIDSKLKDTSIETIAMLENVQSFKYRYLTNNEMTLQPLSSWLKGQFEKVLYTSETNIVFNERDFVLFENKQKARITRVIPQVQHGMFLISKKYPHILELS